MIKRTLAFVLALTCMVGMMMTLSACNKITAEKDLETVQKNGVIKVGMECNYAPFNWTQTASSDTAVALSAGGYGDGYDVQVALKLATALGVTLEIVKLEWEGLIPALESGKIDCIIAGMSPTAERKESIDFSDPYYKSELVVVVKGNGAYASATTLADFSGAKITGQLDTCNYTVIDQIPNVEKQTALESFPAMITSLQGGKIDGYVCELPAAKSAVVGNSDLTYIRFAEGQGFVASDDEIAVSVGIRKGSNLADALNNALSAITEEDRGTLMEWALANQPLSES